MFRILIVEDNDINRKVLCAYLKKEEISITIAKNGSEAVSLFENASYDLILMDIAMPEMDGIQATKRIRKTEKKYKRRTPIIAVTASDAYNNRHVFFKAGIDDYIAKPINPEILEEKINLYSDIQLELY